MKTKLNILFISLAGAVLMTMTSCLDVVNSDRLNSTNMWVEESDITGATTGIYYRFRTAFRQGYTNQFYWGELRVGPAMWDRGTHRSLMDATMLEVLHSNLSGSTSSVNWSYLYTCVDQCNSVLKYAPRVSMSEANYNFCVGNAHFIRAFCYYWIARIWGDAPIILNPTESTGSEIFPSRADKSEVYTQVESDIEEALTYITDNSDCYYATVNNLNMLKADYALWMYSAQNGGSSYLTMAEEALGNITGVTLLDDFADVFDVKNKKNKEIMFAIHCDATNEQNSAAYIQRFIWGSTQILAAYRNVEGGVPVQSNQWFCFSDNFIDELKANRDNYGDTRTNVTYQERYGMSDMYERIEWPNKFTGDWSSGDLLYDDDLILYRGAQYYMFLAELNYYKGNYSAALSNLNVVCERAYGKSNFYTSTAANDVWEALAKENRWEFVEEGNLWFTYIRLGYIDTYCPLQLWENTGVVGGVGGSTNPNIYLFPIQTSAINKNSNLKQTEGW